jgi:hypothetical protein
MKTLVLVACAQRKLDHPAKASELYTSQWFDAAKCYAVIMGNAWRILSAKHGLLHPETIIEPYDESLNTRAAAERQGWAVRVSKALREQFPADQWKLIILAGKAYREPLVGMLETYGYKVEVPMQGLGIGQQIKWLNYHLHLELTD